MKKFILPLVAVLFLTAAASAQTSKKATPMKAVATSTPKKEKVMTAKTVNNADTTKPKMKTTMPATKKKHHKTAKKTTKKTSGK